MLPQKIFKIFDTVVAILILFEQFSGKFCAPNSECFIKCEPFCSYIFDHACWGRKAYCYRKGLKLWKNYCIYRKHVRKWLAGGCIPHILPWIRPWSLIVTKLLPDKKQINGNVIIQLLLNSKNSRTSLLMCCVVTINKILDLNTLSV